MKENKTNCRLVDENYKPNPQEMFLEPLIMD